MNKPPFFMDAADLLRKELTAPRRTSWGAWKLFDEGLEHEFCGYFILFDRINGPQDMSDWLRQLAGKSWITAEDLGSFVLAVRDTIGLSRRERIK